MKADLFFQIDGGAVVRTLIPQTHSEEQRKIILGEEPAKVERVFEGKDWDDVLRQHKVWIDVAPSDFTPVDVGVFYRVARPLTSENTPEENEREMQERTQMFKDIRKHLAESKGSIYQGSTEEVRFLYKELNEAISLLGEDTNNRAAILEVAESLRKKYKSAQKKNRRFRAALRWAVLNDGPRPSTAELDVLLTPPKKKKT